MSCNCFDMCCSWVHSAVPLLHYCPWLHYGLCHIPKLSNEINIQFPHFQLEKLGMMCYQALVAGVTGEGCHAGECHLGKWSRDSSRILR